MKFKEEDKKRVVDFLNFIAEKAEFKLNTQDTIKYFGLLSYMQKELLPKIDANVLEIKSIKEDKEDSK